ncbi:hypothetical protein LTR70_006344 [Exophiala xenobiotica]|uniref:F-box domain-containing protein n=1 Tax=Lithohypha guttulata TaxID=1690604 RepID=A0ABR0K7V5_9EURO|nr:hypothetical protein LTR24_005813 [Lithohypha guttulata]KAK5316289.1 hypothetical protein LTR70_006344 [Exophiala xenobiotica]
MTLDALPQDILLLILQYLEAYDLRRLQLVSRCFRATFSEHIYLRTILKGYSHAREVRYLLFKDYQALSSSQSLSQRHNYHPTDLQTIFNTIATRYYHLTQGKSRSIRRINLRALDQSGHWLPTPQWDYHESQPGGRLYHEHASHIQLRSVNGVSKPYLFRPTLWSYDDGLLVFAPARNEEEKRWTVEETSHVGSERKTGVLHEDRCLVVLNLESDAQTEVPFDVHGKIIRNLRLKERVLIVEWAERDAFHDLNMVDRVHRHFATAFRIKETRTNENSQPSDTSTFHEASTADRQPSVKLDVHFHSEWRIHFLGFPLTSRDHFFSTHTATHYCLYYWQPNRSLWTGDEDQPIEALQVWDISQACPYRPSEDPGNIHRDSFGKDGPYMVAKFAMRMLGYLGARQQGRISLLGLSLDSQMRTVSVRQNVFESGQGYFDPAERNWCASVTSFPFVGLGPVHRREGHVELPSYRGHCSMESDEIEEIEKWFLPVMDVVDRSADVRFSLIETCFTGMMIENRVMLRLKVLGEWRDVVGEVAKEVGVMGRIAGDERWVIGQNERLQVVVARFQ